MFPQMFPCAKAPFAVTTLNFTYKQSSARGFIYFLLTPLVVGLFLFLLYSTSAATAIISCLILVGAIRFCVGVFTKSQDAVSLVTMTDRTISAPSGKERITLWYAEIDEVSAISTHGDSYLTIRAQRDAFVLKSCNFENAEDFRAIKSELEARVKRAHDDDETGLNEHYADKHSTGELRPISEKEGTLDVQQLWRGTNVGSHKGELEKYQMRQRDALLFRQQVILPMVLGLLLITLFSLWIYFFLKGTINFDRLLDMRSMRGPGLIAALWVTALACLVGGLASFLIAFRNWKPSSRDRG